MKIDRTKGKLICFTVVALCSLLCAGSVYAAGRVLIKPFIETGWQTDSNFHKAETDEKTVYTYNVKPGIDLGYTTEKSLVSLNYYANIFRYDDQDDIAAGQIHADDFDYVAHRAMFSAQTKATERLLLGVDNLYWKTRDPANADVNSNAVDRFKYTMNQFTPRLSYRFGEKFGIDLKYKNLLTNYSDDGPGQGEDYTENRGTFTLNYYFTPRTSFNLDYQVWSTDYDKTTVDYDSNQVMANVSHQFNKLTFTAGAGYHNRDFDQTVASGDIDQFVWKVSVSGKNPPDAVGIPKSSMFIQFGSNLNDAGTGDTYYNSTRLDARFSYLVFEKVNCILSGYFQNSDYETSDREDDRWYVDLSVDYLINDYFSLGVKGGLEDRDSTDAGKDFDNQFVMLMAKFNYDMGSR